LIDGRRDPERRSNKSERGETMRILLDEGGEAKTARARARPASRRGASAGKIDVSCPRGADRECACPPVDLADQPEHASAVLDALGVALLNRGCLEQGARLIEQALRIRRKAFGDDHPATALSLNSYGRVLRERGELAGAEETVELALKINRNTYGRQALPIAVSSYELGVIHLNQGRYAEAESAAIEGLQILQKLGIDDTDPHTSRLLDIRGRAEAARGALDAAAATLKSAVELDRAQVGGDHPKFATHLANLANVRHAQGEHKQAESFFLKAIDVYAGRLKRRCHPNLIDMYANLGSLYLARNSKPTDLRAAGRYLNEALRLNLKVRGPAHLLVANDYANLGRLRYQQKDRRGALNQFLNALKIYERNLKRGSIPESYPFLAEVLTWAGRLLVEGGSGGETVKAEAFLDRAVRIWDASGEAGKIGKAAAEACRGRALHLQGKDPDRACRLLTGAYAVLSEELGADYPFVEIVRAWVGDLGVTARAA
jgi:tetratricopeptide (TPR) repeat protein